MSINKIDSYSIVCDHCQETLETTHEGFAIFVDEQAAQEEIDRAEWFTEEGYEEQDLHYCPLCHFIDDNDEMHLRMERMKEKPSSLSESKDLLNDGEKVHRWVKGGERVSDDAEDLPLIVNMGSEGTLKRMSLKSTLLDHGEKQSLNYSL